MDKLREEANSIDSLGNPAKAIVSVMMLKEGWDVRNVTTIVGLRAYSAKSNILPEQILGRGLRKMYPGGLEEYVSVVSTNAFMDFVESIQAEGVVLERKPMGEGTQPKTPLMVEVDEGNERKDLEALDIEIPRLTPRVYREYKNLSDLDVCATGNHQVLYRQFSPEERREIVFKDVTTGMVAHTTILDTAGIADTTALSVISRRCARGRCGDSRSHQTARDAPFVVKEQVYVVSKKSVSNRTIGDSRFELEFASFLEDKCKDVESYAKNYLAVGFKLDYVKADGDISNYYPDFMVRTTSGEIWIVETKGREDVDDPGKWERLKQWCADASALDTERHYHALFVRQEDWERYRPQSFHDAIAAFATSGDAVQTF